MKLALCGATSEARGDWEYAVTAASSLVGWMTDPDLSTLVKSTDLFKNHWMEIAPLPGLLALVRWIRRRWNRWRTTSPQIIIADAAAPYGTCLGEWWYVGLSATNQLRKSADVVRACLDFRHETGLRFAAADTPLVVPERAHEGRVTTRAVATPVRLGPEESAEVMLAAWIDPECAYAALSWPPSREHRLVDGVWRCEVVLYADGRATRRRFEAQVVCGRLGQFKRVRGLLG
jgi:hypothetical protein